LFDWTLIIKCFSKSKSIFFSSENWSSLQEGDIIGSEEEEQEDPKDYLKGIFYITVPLPFER
jgi:hypothetical protein